MPVLSGRSSWYQNTTIYQIDPTLFFDSNGDGWGDLAGIRERLGYLREVGADCLWLLPFYTSPRRDGGYDINDHLGVDSRLGDLAEVAELLNQCDQLGLRVLLDLVPQHTSIDHPWFQQARSDRRSPYRDYYVWSDEPVETGVEPVFPTVEDSVWTWDEQAQQYYRHTFFSHEPDLELGNPDVRREIFQIMAFWLRLGVTGFRIDAVPYLIERARAVDDRDDGLWLLDEMHQVATQHNRQAVLMGEVDVGPDQYPDYLGGDRRLTMLLDFWKNNHLYLALARADAEPLVRAIKEQPAPDSPGRYVSFLRNHDELDLEQLSEDERKEVTSLFGPEDRMLAYGRGIRRRLAPILDGDVRRIAMVHAIGMGLPGPQVMLYGDEIGMGDDLERPDRASVRLPMQWSGGRNGGFSDAAELPVPAVADGPYGHRRVNLAAQHGRVDSLFQRVADIVRARRGALEIGTGSARTLNAGPSSVLCLEHDAGSRLITAVNLAPDPVRCELSDLDIGRGGVLADVLADRDYQPVERDPVRFDLDGYGYRWFRDRA